MRWNPLNIIISDSCLEAHSITFNFYLTSIDFVQVKLANQEIDLVALLKRIPLGPNMLSAIRERGDQLRNGTMRCRGDALLPLSLASYIFDALCMPGSHQWLQVIPGLLLNHGLCCRLFVCLLQSGGGGAGRILIFAMRLVSQD